MFYIGGIYSNRTTPKIHIEGKDCIIAACKTKMAGTQGLTEEELEFFLQNNYINLNFGGEWIKVPLCKKCAKIMKRS